MAATTTAPRHNTWPPSKARRHPSDERRFWTLLPLACIDKLNHLETNFSHLGEVWASLSSHASPHISVRWLSPHEIFGHRKRFDSGRRSRSLEPEPTLGDTESNHLNFNRMNSASPEENSQVGSSSDNSLLLGLGAGLSSQYPIFRRPGPDGTMTPNSQSIVLSPHYRGSLTGSPVPGLSATVHGPLLLALAVGCPSPYWQSPQAPTENPGSPRPSVSGTETRNRSSLRHSTIQIVDETILRPTTETDAQGHELYDIDEEAGEPSSSRKRKRSHLADDDHLDERQNDPCPCCKRPRSAHNE